MLCLGITLVRYQSGFVFFEDRGVLLAFEHLPASVFALRIYDNYITKIDVI